jgi:hypothetical protein
MKRMGLAGVFEAGSRGREKTVRGGLHLIGKKKKDCAESRHARSVNPRNFHITPWRLMRGCHGVSKVSNARFINGMGRMVTSLSRLAWAEPWLKD